MDEIRKKGQKKEVLERSNSERELRWSRFKEYEIAGGKYRRFDEDELSCTESCKWEAENCVLGRTEVISRFGAESYAAKESFFQWQGSVQLIGLKFKKKFETRSAFHHTPLPQALLTQSLKVLHLISARKFNS